MLFNIVFEKNKIHAINNYICYDSGKNAKMFIILSSLHSYNNS